MSFVVLTTSQVMPQANDSLKAKSTQDGGRNVRGLSDEQNLLSQKMVTAARLFEVLSARSDIDHPVCVECTELLLERMEKRLTSVTREKDGYLDFLRNANADFPSDEERAQARANLQKVQEEEESAIMELEKLELEKNELEQELASLEEEARTLDTEEDAFWRERNQFYQGYKAMQDERDSLNLRFEHDSAQLDWLQRTNVYNDTFPISHDGKFATINSLRLGRLSNHPVDWPEINAAWGQACLLLATVADKLSFTFQGYTLKPMGSTSTIERFENTGTQSSMKTITSSLPLHYTSELPLTINFLYRHFDTAMVAFLECLRQLGKHVERTTAKTSIDGGLKMPYDINKDKINDCSIKLGGFNADETWTKACKFTLTCCKFLLAQASNVNNARRSNGG